MVSKHNFTKKQIIEALAKFNSQAMAAKDLGCSQMTVSRLKIKYEIEHDGKVLANKKKGKKHSLLMKHKYSSGEIVPYWLGKKVDKELAARRARHLIGKKPWNFGKKSYKQTICATCKEKFEHSTNRERKFCSRLCSDKHMSVLYSGGRLKGKNNPNFGNGDKIKAAVARGCYKNVVHKNYTRGKWTIYNGVKMHSTWEANYAKYLDENNIKWLYEYKRFYLSDGRHYTPDFYLPDTNEYIEIKGHWYPSAKEKFEKFKKEFPEIKITVVEKEIWKSQQNL